MFCNYVDLALTDPYLKHCGLVAYLWAKENQPFCVDVYEKDFNWLKDQLESLEFDKAKIVQIFAAGKTLFIKNNMDQYCRFIFLQVTILARIVAEKQGMSDKLDDRFLRFENYAKNIDDVNKVDFNFAEVINGTV